MTTKKLTNGQLPSCELTANELDQILGGATLLGYQLPQSGGVYLSAGGELFGNGKSYTASLGTDGLHFYSTDANGLGTGEGAGTGGSLTAGFGFWNSDTSQGSDFFTGAGHSASIDIAGGPGAGLTTSWNGSGSSAGFTLGVGAALEGVDVSYSATNSHELHGSNGSEANEQSDTSGDGHEASGDSHEASGDSHEASGDSHEASGDSHEGSSDGHEASVGTFGNDDGYHNSGESTGDGSNFTDAGGGGFGDFA